MSLDTPPIFMRSVVRYERPKFDPADLLPGMAVVLVRRGHVGPDARFAKGKVLSKARVWVTIEEMGNHAFGGQPRRWKMRLDDQTDGTGSYYADRFRTLAQQEYQDTRQAALDFLSEQGLRIEGGGPWGGREIELARLVFPGRRGEQSEGR